MSLQVHLPGQHMVLFNPNELIETVAAYAEQERTMLMAFFQLNHDDPLARQYTYQETLQHFVWDCRNKEWRHCQHGSTV
jgi:hypothetical protein